MVFSLKKRSHGLSEMDRRSLRLGQHGESEPWRGRRRTLVSEGTLGPHLSNPVEHNPRRKEKTMRENHTHPSPEMEAAARQARIAQLKKDLQELSGDRAIFCEFNEACPEIQEKFLEEVLEFERACRHQRLN